MRQQRLLPAFLLPVLLAAGIGAATRPAAAGTLYAALGERDGITRIVDAFYRHVLADPRVSPVFADIDTGFIKKHVVLQICQMSGGPCAYAGPSMRGAHKGLGITERQFNAVVEDLQDGMDDAGVAFATQGRLLAILAPLEAQIVQR